MTAEKFFDLFLQELASSSGQMNSYYKFLNGEKSFEFRKAYFIQRLQYIIDHIDNRKKNVFDCGCGYGTTCLFLAMNGIRTYGTTLEFYFDRIRERKQYWSQYGDVNLFQVDYADLFDGYIDDQRFDYIILQDTLHHLEPIGQAISIFYKILNKYEGGKLIVIEENGANIIQCMKLFAQRGTKRVITIWDERLQKNILLGNENIRSLRQWKREFAKNGMKVDDSTVQYIRYYLPSAYAKSSTEEIMQKEKHLANNNTFLRNYFFFGLNFTVR